jgi:hypothetical protein
LICIDNKAGKIGIEKLQDSKMAKSTSSIAFRPDLGNHEEKVLLEYLKSQPQSVSATCLGILKMVLLPNALLMAGNPDPNRAMDGILDLSLEIDKIYAAYVLAGINLPPITKIYGFGGGTTTVNLIAATQSPETVQKSVALDDNDDDDDSWDEIPRTPLMPEPDYDLDN